MNTFWIQNICIQKKSVSASISIFSCQAAVKKDMVTCPVLNLVQSTILADC